MPKSDDKIREDVSVFDMLAEYGGWLVAAGLVFEVILAFAHRGDKPFLEAWGPVIANALVAIGVIAEIYFTRLSSQGQSELDRRSEERVATANLFAAEASERAAKAEREAERLRVVAAWRHISPNARRLLTDELVKIAPQTVALVVVLGDAESRNFAQEFQAIFQKSGWEVTFVVAGYAGSPVYGLRIAVNFTDERYELGMKLKEAFYNASIQVGHGEPPPAFMTTPSSNPPSGKMAVLYVGPKGEPAL